MANITNALEIVCITIFLAFFTEFVNWVLVYRLPGYKKNLKLSADINDQLETLKESLSVSSPSEAKKLKRKIKEKKAQLKTVGTAMSGTKIKSTFVMIMTTVAVFAILGSAYEGEIVLKLPFEPISFLRGMSHRGIETEDYYDCSFLFVYVLGNMCLRPAVTNFLGFEPPKGAQKSMWTPPSLDEDED